MRAAYRDFKKQHPRPIRAAPPYAPTGSEHEPVPPVTGPVPPLTLLLASNEAKPTQTTVIQHGAEWRIPKHQLTARDLPKVPHDSQTIPRTCWARDPKAPTTSWPVLHLIARHDAHPTTHLPPQAYAWVAPWFHHTDANPRGSVVPRPHTQMALHHYTHLAPPRPGRGRHPLKHVPTRQNRQARAPLLSAPPLLQHTGAPNTNPLMPRPNPRHSLHPPLHLLRPQTRTAGTGTHSHVSPSKTQHHQRNRGGHHPCPAAHNPRGPPHHGPRHIRLPANEPMPPPTSITSKPALLHRRLRRIRPHAHQRGGHPAANPHRGTLPHGPPHGPHHLRGLLPRGARGHGRRHSRDPGPPTCPPPAHCPGLMRGRRHCRHTPAPPHSKATTPQSHRDDPQHPGTAALESFSQPSPLRQTPDQQESHRHQYGDGKVDNQAVHQRTTHLPTLQIPDLGRNHTHPQHIPPKPESHQTPDWVPEDTPYSSHDRAYHYSNRIEHLASVLGNTDSRAHPGAPG